MHRMDLRQLRQFVAVAEERSFRRAAERLHVSQPPLTVTVQRLEAEVGVQLLDRNRHGVRLTPAGEAFLEEARCTLAHAQLAVEIAQRAASGKVGTLRLSFVVYSMSSPSSSEKYSSSSSAFGSCHPT